MQSSLPRISILSGPVASRLAGEGKGRYTANDSLSFLCAFGCAKRMRVPAFHLV